MNKKIKYVLIFFIFIAVGVTYLLMQEGQRYDMEQSVKAVKIVNKTDLQKYYKYILKYMKPSKLSNFSEFTDVYLKDYTEKATGYTVLDDLSYDAYKRLFNGMFKKNRINYDDCPVTDNFKKKFDKNLFIYFNLVDSNDSLVDCQVDRQDLALDVEEAGDFIAGEPGYIYYHHFHYTLDEEGNVDDIIFDYTE